MKFEFTELIKIIENIDSQANILTIQPGGNHGDTLIYHGFREIQNQRNWNAEELLPGGITTHETDEFPNQIINRIKYGISNVVLDANPIKLLKKRLSHDFDAVYIHGGGNFNDLWGNSIKNYKLVSKFFDCPIIIGPQSVQFDYSDPNKIFSEVNNETHFLCRETFSYDLMKEIEINHDHLHVYIEHDTAFKLKPSDFSFSLTQSYSTLVAMRQDKESVNPKILESCEPPILFLDVSRMAKTYKEFVNIIVSAEYIHTDRLHVAVLGHILNKQLTLYGNGYHKNKGVYEYSIFDDPNISFVED